MAKILGFTYGELRGKIGGTVFSRNKAGAYARAKVTPVNPQTVRQQTARYSFGNNSILYQNLTPSQKNCWATFAQTHFNPLKGNSTGIYSGGNAFVALQSSVTQGNRVQAEVQGIQDSNAYVMEAVPYTVLGECPDTPTSATIQDDLGNAHPFLVTVNSVDSGGNVGYAISFPDVPSDSLLTYNSFVNAENQNFGIGFYMSNNLKFSGAKPNTVLKLNFAGSGVVTNIDLLTGSGAPLMADSLFVNQTSVLVPEEIRAFPCAGDVIMVTPFIRSSDGAQKLMAPEYITVSAIV